MEKLAPHYTTEELNQLRDEQREITIFYIYNRLQGLCIGLKGKIVEVRIGGNPPNIASSIDFEPTEQSEQTAINKGVEVPIDISILEIALIRVPE